MYHIRNASLAPDYDNHEGLITTAQLEAAYKDAQLKTDSYSTQALWHTILVQQFPEHNSTNPRLSFKISNIIDHSEINAGHYRGFGVSFVNRPNDNYDPRVLLVIGLQGQDRDTVIERQLLVVRLVEWSKRELKKGRGIRFFFGLLVVGTHARLVKYDKYEEVLKPFFDDQWFDAKDAKWSEMMDDVKRSIADAVSVM